MKMGKIWLVVTLFAVIPMAKAKVKNVPSVMLNSTSQTPSYGSLMRLAKLQKMDRNFEDMLKNKELFNHIMQMQIIQKQFNFNDYNLSPQQKEQVQKVVNTFMEKVFEEQNNAEFRQQCINTYIETVKSIYTQQEVDALIEFYDNPIGQSLIEKQTIVAKQYTANILPIIQNNSTKVVEKNIPAFYLQLDEILGKSRK